MTWFVVTRRFDGEESFALMSDAPRRETREEKTRHIAVLQLTPFGAAGSLDNLIAFWKAMNLSDNGALVEPGKGKTA